jgi:CspA family cold shock protein
LTDAKAEGPRLSKDRRAATRRARVMPARCSQGKSRMPTGSVKWFNATKGYGFIQPDDGGKDVFVHITQVQRAGLDALADGQKVSFQLETRRDGRTAASDIKVL